MQAAGRFLPSSPFFFFPFSRDRLTMNLFTIARCGLVRGNEGYVRWTQVDKWTVSFLSYLLSSPFFFFPPSFPASYMEEEPRYSLFISKKVIEKNTLLPPPSFFSLFSLSPPFPLFSNRFFSTCNVRMASPPSDGGGRLKEPILVFGMIPSGPLYLFSSPDLVWER